MNNSKDFTFNTSLDGFHIEEVIAIKQKEFFHKFNAGHIYIDGKIAIQAAPLKFRKKLNETSISIALSISYIMTALSFIIPYFLLPKLSEIIIGNMGISYISIISLCITIILYCVISALGTVFIPIIVCEYFSDKIFKLWLKANDKDPRIGAHLFYECQVDDDILNAIRKMHRWETLCFILDRHKDGKVSYQDIIDLTNKFSKGRA